MSAALYRTYRPKTFADVINQEHIKATLQNQIKSKKVAHAYLFAGPRGVGKTTMARIFAKAINGITDDATQLDIIEIDAASHTGVDNVRENIIQSAYVVPSKLTYKVFIIDEVHMLSVSAFNALLKILEEPPEHVVFILATTEVHKLPATVVSRCQRFDFHTIRLTDMVKRLQWLCAQEHVQVDDDVLTRIARKAQGGVRDAESLLGQVLAIGEQRITADQADIVLPRVDLATALELFSHLVEKQPQAYSAAVTKAMDSGAQVKELHTLLLDISRRGMLYSVDHSLSHLEDLDVHTSTHEQLLGLFTKLNTMDYLRLLELFTEALSLYQRSPIPQLMLEAPGLEWCYANTIMAAPMMSAPVPAPAPATPVSKAMKTAPTHSNVASSTTKPVAKASASQVSSSAVPYPELLENVKGKWPQVVNNIKAVNHALAMALSVAHVAYAFQPNIIQLGFRYDFHKNKVCQPEFIKAIRTVLQDLLQQEFIIECIVGEQYDIDANVLNTMPSDNIAAVNPPELDNVWDLALQTIGGKEVKN